MRVLIADDQRDTVETLAMLCDAWGYQSTVVYDGNAALAHLRQPNSPMLCLLDWQMPGVTGIEICHEVRREKDRPYRYIILITGRGNRNDMLAGLNAGADDFLLKPVDADELRARLITGTRVLNLQDQLLRTMRSLEEQATHDGLTGLWNRNAIFQILEREMSRRDRQNQSLSLALVDLDHFKEINDTRGHVVGDHVLREVATRLLGGVRAYDSVGRYGGEEFMIVLPGCDQAEALQLGERLRRTIEREIADACGNRLLATACLGVSTWNGQSAAADLVRRADRALYAAKNRGRNRVVGDD